MLNRVASKTKDLRLPSIPSIGTIESFRELIGRVLDTERFLLITDAKLHYNRTNEGSNNVVDIRLPKSLIFEVEISKVMPQFSKSGFKSLPGLGPSDFHTYSYSGPIAGPSVQSTMYSMLHPAAGLCARIFQFSEPKEFVAVPKKTLTTLETSGSGLVLELAQDRTTQLTGRTGVELSPWPFTMGALGKNPSHIHNHEDWNDWKAEAHAALVSTDGEARVRALADFGNMVGVFQSGWARRWHTERLYDALLVSGRVDGAKVLFGYDTGNRILAMN